MGHASSLGIHLHSVAVYKLFTYGVGWFILVQGRLVRTILFSTQQMNVNTRESLLFILFLMCFAVAASAYVLVQGRECAVAKLVF